MSKPAAPLPDDPPLESRVRVARVDELPDDGVLGARAAGVELVIVKHSGKLAIFEGRCLHQGTLLSEGSLEDGVLVCRAHGWRYDCASGKLVDQPKICLERFSAHVRGDEIQVDPNEILAWQRAKQDAAAETRAAASKLRSAAELPGPRALPLIGNAWSLDLGRLHLILEQWCRELGPIYGLKIGRRQALVVADPELIERVLRDRPDTYRRLGTIERALESMGISGVFSAEGAAWRAQRRLVIRALDSEHLRHFFPTLAGVTRRLERRWRAAAREQRVLDAQKELMRYTVDVTTNLAFGYDMNTLEQDHDVIQDQLEQLFPMLNRRINALVPYWRYVKFPADRAFERAMAEVSATIVDFIERARKRLREPPSNDADSGPRNFLEAMLLARTEDDSPLDEKIVLGNVYTMLLAGEDTTANTLAWALDFVCQNPSVQASMQREADAVLGASDVLPELRDAEQLHYIEAVILETMRLKPVAPLLFFEPNLDVVLGDVAVPKGTAILVPTRYACLQEENFEAAHDFEPERWLSDRGKDDRAHGTYVPFGFGPRLCPGRALAMLEMKMLLATTCRHFDVGRAAQTKPVQELFSFTLVPRNLRIELRERA